MSVPWPGGARCAVRISWDVGADSLVLHRFPERGYQLYAALSWLRYEEVAVPAIVKALDRYGIKQTVCVTQEGFLYDSSLMSDSRPFLIRAGGGELIELPIETTMSDWPHYAHVPNRGYLMPPKSPAAAMEVFRVEFDAAYELGGLWITIWHPPVSARPARMLAWANLVEYMQGKDDVWFATLDEIARHVRSCVDGGTHVPRVVDLPYYESPPPEFSEL